MAHRTEGAVVRLKRLLRYVKGAPRVAWTFPWQGPVGKIICQCDSDWASCRRTRRSTSGGGVICVGRHLIHHWSRTQSTVALSSGEAELNSALKGASEALLFRNMAREMAEDYLLEIQGDSAASRGMLLREGAGAVKHLSVRQLWLQEFIARKELTVVQIPRAQNPSDALTHHWSPEAGGHYASLGLVRHAQTSTPLQSLSVRAQRRLESQLWNAPGGRVHENSDCKQLLSTCQLQPPQGKCAAEGGSRNRSRRGAEEEHPRAPACGSS